MGVLKVIVVTAMLATQAAELPPPYPRPGTTKLLENDAVAVWDVVVAQTEISRFTRTAMTWSASPTRRAIGSSPRATRPGGWCHTKAWVFQTNRAGVTHVEEGASDPPMRAVQIEVKYPRPRDTPEEPADGLRQVAGAPAWENNRAAAWLVTGGSSAPTHRHVGDAVEMVFDASTPPTRK